MRGWVGGLAVVRLVFALDCIGRGRRLGRVVVSWDLDRWREGGPGLDVGHLGASSRALVLAGLLLLAWSADGM